MGERAEQKEAGWSYKAWITGGLPCLHIPQSTVRVLGRAGAGPAPPTDPDPLRSPSLMSGLASLDAKTSSRLGILTVAYYLWTTFVAVIVGIIMVSVIHPGGAAQKEITEQTGKPIMSSADALLDLIR